jgi:hypothetical protein
MSEDLLRRQLARQRAPHLASSGKTAKPVDTGSFDEQTLANPASAASIVVDQEVARRIARARAALDKKANVRAHIERYERDKMPAEYMKEVNKATRVAQRVFNKGSRKETSSGASRTSRLRVPQAEREAQTRRNVKKNNARASQRGSSSASAGKSKKSQRR